MIAAAGVHKVGRFPNESFHCEHLIRELKRGGVFARMVWLPKGGVMCASRILVLKSGVAFLLLLFLLSSLELSDTHVY